MKASKLLGTLSAMIIIGALQACKDDNGHTDEKRLRVRYLAEEVCCGDMEVLDNKLVARICEIPDDVLLKAVNLDDFAIAQNLQDGDTLTIEFKLTEDCQASCDIICNRHSAIPVKLISVE